MAGIVLGSIAALLALLVAALLLLWRYRRRRDTALPGSSGRLPQDCQDTPPWQLVKELRPSSSSNGSSAALYHHSTATAAYVSSGALAGNDSGQRVEIGFQEPRELDSVGTESQNMRDRATDKVLRGQL